MGSLYWLNTWLRCASWGVKILIISTWTQLFIIRIFPGSWSMIRVWSRPKLQWKYLLNASSQTHISWCWRYSLTHSTDSSARESENVEEVAESVVCWDWVEWGSSPIIITKINTLSPPLLPAAPHCSSLQNYFILRDFISAVLQWYAVTAFILTFILSYFEMLRTGRTLWTSWRHEIIYHQLISLKATAFLVFR